MKRYIELPVRDVEAAIIAYAEAKGLKPVWHDDSSWIDGPRQLARKIVCLGRRTDEANGIECLFLDSVQVEVEDVDLSTLSGPT